MEFQAKLEFRGLEQFTTQKGTFYSYYFENSAGKPFTFVTKKQYPVEKSKQYVLTLTTNQLFLNDVKGL